MRVFDVSTHRIKKTKMEIRLKILLLITLYTIVNGAKLSENRNYKRLNVIKSQNVKNDPDSQKQVKARGIFSNVNLTTSVRIFLFLDFTLTQIFNNIDIQPTYMHKYSRSLSLVSHSLIYMLEPQVRTDVSSEVENTDEIIKKAEMLRRREIVSRDSNSVKEESSKEKNVFEERRTEKALNAVLARPLSSAEETANQVTDQHSPCSPLFPHNEGPTLDPCHTEVEKKLTLLRRKHAGTGATGLETLEPRGFVRAETWKLTPPDPYSSVNLPPFSNHDGPK